MKTPTSPARILLVEDDPDDAVLLERAFRRTEIADRLDVVHDGDEAIEYLTATGRYGARAHDGWPTLVIVDLTLPRRNGHEVVRWIRWEAGVTHLPVVVLTASERPGDIRRAYELGANSYLLKPSSSDELDDLARTLARYWLGMNVGGPADDL